MLSSCRKPTHAQAIISGLAGDEEIIANKRHRENRGYRASGYKMLIGVD
jgi:hypothetical protein